MQPTFKGVLVIAALTAFITLADRIAMPAPAQPVAEASAPSGAAVPKVSGNASAGRNLFTTKACGACHVAQGVAGAVGTVGPSLNGLGDPTKRPTLASGEPNTPANITAWIKDPATKKPGTLMPNLGLTAKEADDLTAFLVTLR